MSDRMAAALAVGLALAVVAGDARAAPTCSPTTGAFGIRLTDCSVSRTGGSQNHGVYNTRHVRGDITIDLTRVDVSTTGYASLGVAHSHSGPGAQVIRMTGGSIATTGYGAAGVFARALYRSNATPSTIALSGVAISTTGEVADGVHTWHQARGAQAIRMTGGSIVTTGPSAVGISVFKPGATGKLAIDVSGGATIETRSYGIEIDERTSSGTAITLSDASIEIRRHSRHALYRNLIAAIAVHRDGRRAEDGAQGDLVIDLTRATLTATPTAPHGFGVYAREWGVGDIRVNFASGRIRTGAVNGVGVFAIQGYAISPRASVANHGLWTADVGAGSIATTIGAEARIEAPFSVGVSGVLGSPKDGTGRIVVTHAGGIEARDAGILAWASRWSGSTFGDGYEATADDAARTAPMIHVTSSGDITVGSGVMDAFIRAVVAGADGTLSPAERRVLDAIVEDEDPDALETALAALPATWTEERKAEARALLASRTWTPGPGWGWEPGFSGRSDAEANRLLGLSAAGIRALVHSHNWIADHVRTGNVDPELSRRLTLTDKETATLDTQRDFSEAEREIVKAVLAGGEGLEALLADLPPAYTDAWKDETRRLALLYNEGDVRVDVTGGTITAEGYGVDARYAVPHDRNGAIAVTVAAGATVSGGRHGVHVGGAGLAAGNGALRDQTVTVNGAVSGGSGAGVHLAGGGTLMVGDAGRVGAASGVGVLSEGTGDFKAVVHGAVEGDVRAQGGGDLDATVYGTVEGDLLVRDGGALTLEVKDGGAVAGTVHDPAGPLTVEGSIGRVLYGNGGTVTIGGAGRLPRLTGVEVEGGREAVRSAAGDLEVRVETKGRVVGHVRGMGDGGLRILVAGTLRGDVIEEGAGDLSATISGVVEGNVFGRGTGEHMVTVSKDGTVTGAIHLSASVVTVDGTAGRVLFDRGGMVTIGPQGRITDPGTGIEARGGELVVVIQPGAGETPGAALSRSVRGKIVELGDDGEPDILTQREGEAARRVPVGGTGTAPSLPDGARDVGLMRDGPGLRVVSDYAPRSRVYEALPSVLLGLNDLPTHRDRLAAARSPNGGWARVDAEGGERRAKRSTSTSGAGIAYDHRRYGVRTGFDAPFGTSGMAGVSAHYRRGSAELSGKDGEIEASGAGFGVSGAWQFPDGIYLDGQLSATWYEAEVKSGSHGVLKSDAKGFGHALGLEAGRRLAMGGGRVTLTPRARLVRSQLRLKEFTDALGSQVSLKKGRSMTGGAGLRAETAPSGLGGGRLFASVEVEHEFAAETRVRVSGAELSSERDPTRARLALGGSHEWGEGRYAVQGAASYTAGRRGNRDYGGALSLTVRF